MILSYDTSGLQTLYFHLFIEDKNNFSGEIQKADCLGIKEKNCDAFTRFDVLIYCKVQTRFQALPILTMGFAKMTLGTLKARYSHGVKCHFKLGYYREEHLHSPVLLLAQSGGSHWYTA